MTATPLTYYDSPQRSSKKEIEQQDNYLSQLPYINSMLNGFPELAVIIDKNRQIVACNNKALKAFGKSSMEDVIGKRVGEAILCIHRNEMGDNSCGTSSFCAECGAAHAIKFTQDNFQQAVEECRITSEMQGNDESFDFNVVTTPLKIENNYFTLFAISDISGDKRRDALERIFFHDVLNTASVVNSISLLLDEAEDEDFYVLLNSLQESAEQLVQEIQDQRDLKNAEYGKLQTKIESVSVNEIIDKVFSQYVNHKLADSKIITTSKTDKDIYIDTDKRLLLRSLGNLVKNAIEATKKRGRVNIYATVENDDVIFSVKNDGVIPKNVQLQIFQRSFSTKGDYGRGIGTYSVKLLVEQYLGGKVFFNSDKKNGTVFNIKLPNG